MGLLEKAGNVQTEEKKVRGQRESQGAERKLGKKLHTCY